MSAQFGKCNFDGKRVDSQELDGVRPVLAPYGTDAEGIFSKDNVGIIYRAFHTTREARLENQPHISPSGAVITWDGRLDNRSELIHDLGRELSSDSTDLSIVAAAYDRWGTDSFAKIIGDWAVSIWSQRSQLLVLAKDFVGTRHLYYAIDKDQVTWSTILDPLVQFAGRTLALCEEYIAGWLSFFPAPHLTPYVGVDAVPPASFVALRRGKHTIRKYWDFDPSKRVRYQTDNEYEEHFRNAFADAVRRRLRSDSPLVAELSGGIDSSSIVCMADTVIAQGLTGSPRLDTVSYYDDSEPNWNERPYFTKVEKQRGRTGCHIDIRSQETLTFEFESDDFVTTPGSLGHPSKATNQFAAYMNSQASRVVLSGIGGDEVTGGIPTPTPELQDLLARGRFWALAGQLKSWALNKRKPWLHLLVEAGRGFFPTVLAGVAEHKRPAPWLRSDFVKRNRLALHGYEGRVTLFGPLPSFQDNILTIDALRRQVACETLSAMQPYEKRYPYLDRTLLEFLYAIPREQLVRPGQRRSLMRRAFAGTVPDEILNRKRKAFVARAPLLAMSTGWAALLKISHDMVSTSLGIVDPAILCEVMRTARCGRQVPVVFLMRTIGIEIWLRTLRSLDAQSPDTYENHSFSLS